MELSIEDKKKIYISKFELTGRTLNCLQKGEIETLGQLTEMTREKMFKYRNAGPKTVEELDRLLSQNGLSWKEDDTPQLIPIKKTTFVEFELTKMYEKLNTENKKLKNEIENLQQEKFKYNLDKLSLEKKIIKLEEYIRSLNKGIPI